MIDAKKEAAILKWLACYEDKVKDLSDLRSGSVFLQLLSTVDSTINIENVPPEERLQSIENCLCAMHDCLPAHFLVPASTSRKRGGQLELATTAVLVLSGLFLHAASPSRQHSIAPLMNLEPEVQGEIKELLQIVTAAEDVLHNLQGHLQVSSDDESPVSTKRRLKRKRTQYLFSPSAARSPLARVVASPQRSPYSVAMRSKDQKIKWLRQQLYDEEAKVIELEKEVARLSACAEKSEREVSSLKAMVHELSNDPEANIDAEKDGERLKSEVSILKSNLQSLQAMKRDYDDVIRENITLKSKLEEQDATKQQVKTLKASVREAIAEKDAVECKLVVTVQQNALLQAALDEQKKVVETYREFCSSRHVAASMRSPRTPVKSPPGVSCFTELCQVELEQTKDQLQEMERMNCDLKQELLQLQEEEAKRTSEILRVSEALAQSESEKASLGQRIETAFRTIDQLDKTCADNVVSNKELARDNDKLKGDLEESCLLIESLKNNVSNLEACNADLRSNLSAAERRAERASSTVTALEKELSEKAAVCEEVKSKCDLLQVELSQSRSENHALKESYSQLEGRTTDGQHMLEETEQQLEAAVNECRRIEQRSCSLQELVEHLTAERNSLQSVIDTLRDENATIQHDRQQTKIMVESVIKENELLKQDTLSLQESVARLTRECSSLELALNETKAREGVLETELSVMTKTVQELKLQLQENTMSSEEREAFLRHSKETADQSARATRRELEKLQSDHRELWDRLRNTEQDENKLSSELHLLDRKNQILTKSCSELQYENASLQCELEDAKRTMGRVTNENEALKQKVHSLHESLAHLTAERSSLQLTLDRVEAEKSALKTNASTLAQNFHELRLQYQENMRATEEQVTFLTTAKDAATRNAQAKSNELEKLHCDFAKLKDQLKDLEQECDRLRTGLVAATVEKCCIQESRDKLESQHQTLCDQYSDLECKLNRLQESYNHSEEEYFKCVEEKEKNKDELKSTIDEMSQDLEGKTAELHEITRKYSELEEQLKCCASEIQQLEHEGKATSEKLSLAEKQAKKIEDLKPLITEMLNVVLVSMEDKTESKEHQCDEMDVETGLQRLHAAIAQPTATGSKAKTDTQTETIHRMEDELKKLRSEDDAKIKEVGEERDKWKRKHEGIRIFLEKRERQFSKLTSEMKQVITVNNTDMQKLKAQLSEQCEKTKKLETERDRFALENRQLKAEISYCEQQMKDMREHRKGPPSMSSASCIGTPSFKVPTIHREPKRESLRCHNTSITHSAVLNSSIFSENRFTCDEEQDVFFETGLSDLRPIETDVFGRYSELQHRNSMVPPHLKSCYPVETQASDDPTTPLKEASFNRLVRSEDSTKRKRPAVSTRLGSFASSALTKNPISETPKKKNSKGTPSSIRNFIKRQFHKD